VVGQPAEGCHLLNEATATATCVGSAGIRSTGAEATVGRQQRACVAPVSRDAAADAHTGGSPSAAAIRADIEGYPGEFRAVPARVQATWPRSAAVSTWLAGACRGGQTCCGCSRLRS